MPEQFSFCYANGQSPIICLTDILAIRTAKIHASIRRTVKTTVNFLVSSLSACVVALPSEQTERLKPKPTYHEEILHFLYLQNHVLTNSFLVPVLSNLPG